MKLVKRTVSASMREPDYARMAVTSMQARTPSQRRAVSNREGNARQPHSQWRQRRLPRRDLGPSRHRPSAASALPRADNPIAHRLVRRLLKEGRIQRRPTTHLPGRSPLVTVGDPSLMSPSLARRPVRIMGMGEASLTHWSSYQASWAGGKPASGGR